MLRRISEQEVITAAGDASNPNGPKPKNMCGGALPPRSARLRLRARRATPYVYQICQAYTTPPLRLRYGSSLYLILSGSPLGYVTSPPSGKPDTSPGPT